MTSRERVLRAFEHKESDRVPLDFSGHRSSGIAALAYGKLREALALPSRKARVYDSIQQLAIVDDDVRARFGVDTLEMGRGFALADKDWSDWTLPDGTPCQLPSWVRVQRRQDEWALLSKNGTQLGRMPDGALYFEQTNYPFLETDDLPGLRSGVRGIHVAFIVRGGASRTRRGSRAQGGRGEASAVHRQAHRGPVRRKHLRDRPVPLPQRQLLHAARRRAGTRGGIPGRAGPGAPGKPAHLPRGGRRFDRRDRLRGRPGHAAGSADFPRDVPHLLPAPPPTAVGDGEEACPCRTGGESGRPPLRIMLHSCGGIHELLAPHDRRGPRRGQPGAGQLQGNGCGQPEAGFRARTWCSGEAAAIPRAFS